ncbi:MAG TPA: CPBP family intramembrane glutamic endopeptidase [Steroidobacteraceae bacterium]|nr:CPBP family intramembrane glutamic endopeptidase [Steroidobacteraceae bacterium]
MTSESPTDLKPPNSPRFKLRFLPIFVTAVLGYGVPYVAGYGAFYCSKLFNTPSPHGPTLPWLFSQHALQLMLALIVIAVLKFKLVPADYGLHWPRGKTYIGPAILWGIGFGILMTIVDYVPQLLAHTKPAANFPHTPGNIWGWLFFEGIYVGPTEEIPFRALLVTYLATTMPGKFQIGRFNMNWAGIIVALIFVLLHANNFDTRHWPEALGQQFYAFALGILYAYWLEKSKSVVAPIIGHNVGDVVEYIILFAWLGLLWPVSQ